MKITVITLHAPVVVCQLSPPTNIFLQTNTKYNKHTDTYIHTYTTFRPQDVSPLVLGF